MKIECNRTKNKYTEPWPRAGEKHHKPGARGIDELAAELGVTQRKLSVVFAAAKTRPSVLFRGGKTGNRPYFNRAEFIAWWRTMPSSNAELRGASRLHGEASRSNDVLEGKETT